MMHEINYQDMIDQMSLLNRLSRSSSRGREPETPETQPGTDDEFDEHLDHSKSPVRQHVLSSRSFKDTLLDRFSALDEIVKCKSEYLDSRVSFEEMLKNVSLPTHRINFNKPRDVKLKIKTLQEVVENLLNGTLLATLIGLHASTLAQSPQMRGRDEQKVLEEISTMLKDETVRSYNILLDKRHRRGMIERTKASVEARMKDLQHQVEIRKNEQRGIESDNYSVEMQNMEWVHVITQEKKNKQDADKAVDQSVALIKKLESYATKAITLDTKTLDILKEHMHVEESVLAHAADSFAAPPQARTATGTRCCELIISRAEAFLQRIYQYAMGREIIIDKLTTMLETKRRKTVVGEMVIRRRIDQRHDAEKEHEGCMRQLAAIEKDCRRVLLELAPAELNFKGMYSAFALYSMLHVRKSVESATPSPTVHRGRSCAVSPNDSSHTLPFVHAL